LMSAKKKTNAKRRRITRASGEKYEGKVPKTRGQSIRSYSRAIQPSFWKYNVAAYPQRMKTQLHWTNELASSATSGTFSDLQQVILNGPYDPDASWGGSSATAFARMMQVYTKCFVTAACIKVHFINTVTGGALQPTMVGVTASTNSTTFTSLFNATGAGLSEQKFIGANPDNGVVKLDIDMNKFFSITDLLSNPSYACTSSANPGQIVVGHIWVATQAATAAAISYFCEVNFDVVFTDPQPIT